MPETPSTHRTAPVATAPGRPDHRWWLLVVMCLAQLMVILDATIVNIALPSAQEDLGFSSADRQWVVTAYALAFGSLLLVGGRLADFLGRRTAVLVGLAGFALASAVGGAATSFGMLVAARGVQGVFGAVLAPAALAVVTTAFTDQAERHKAFGIFGAVSAAGAATGLLLGGLLTEYASWRWTLYVNLGFAAVAILGTVVLLASERLRAEQGTDVPGMVSITAGLFLLVYGFSSADRDGWGEVSTLVFLAIGALLVAAFFLIERRAAHPVLPLRILASSTRSGSLLVLLLAGVALFSALLFLTYYFQENLGYSPIRAGLAFLPQSAAVVVAVTVGSTWLRTRLAPRAVVAGGLTMAAAGMLLLSRIGVDGPYLTVVLPALVLLGAGLGFSMIVAINLGIAGVEDQDAGVASAAVNAMQQIGGSLGPALFNTIAGSALAGYVAASTDRTPARATGGSTVLEQATVHGYSVVFAISTAILLVGALVAAVMLRRPRETPVEMPDEVAFAL